MSNPDKERRAGIGRRQSDHEDTLEIHVKEKIVTPIFVLLCISVALNAIGLLGIGVLANDTNTVVEDIERQSSPEAQAAEEEFINSILLRVECNERAVLQETFDDLAASGVIPEGSVTVLDDNCPS